MNEWLKKLMATVQNFWKNSSIIKKVILIGVLATIIVLVSVTVTCSSKPAGVRLFNAQVTNESTLNQILDRIDEEGYEAVVSDGYITVSDEKIKRKLVSILTSEGLTPSKWNPFEEYYKRSWSVTDKEQNTRLKEAITERVAQQLEALDDIITAFVTINIPEPQLFAQDQNPVSASVILKLSGDSDLRNNTKHQKSLQKLILTMVEGLKAENLTISDTEGKNLNDFEGMAESDRLSNIERQQKIRHNEEAKLKAYIINTLQTLQVGGDSDKRPTRPRIGDLVVTLEMDMSEKSRDATEYSPIQIKADNPNTPYDDSEYRDVLPISQQTVTKEWQGTGYNPQGPSGVEGQTPPVYSDMSNVIGKSVETGVTQNNVINTTRTTEVVSPQIGKRSVSLNVTGVLTFLRDPKNFSHYQYDEETGLIKTKYTPVPQEDLEQYVRLIKGAIGFDQNRGDLVEVTSIAVDYSELIEEKSQEAHAIEQRNRTILLTLAAIAVVLVGFILFRIISKELERRRRIREEELLRQQQAEREKALWEARDDANMQVTMSVEESRRAELQENAINLAKEHPEDVAMLIRTWLMEE